jgi:hypothetical protein
MLELQHWALPGQQDWLSTTFLPQSGSKQPEDVFCEEHRQGLPTQQHLGLCTTENGSTPGYQLLF